VPGYFFDTSVLAKLYHAETGSEKAEALISQLSLIEIQSVFATKVRTGVIDRSARTSFAGSFSRISLPAVSKWFRSAAGTFAVPNGSYVCMP
jgi:predicted nucleic acid-binding protein